jgi:transposase-like protein
MRRYSEAEKGDVRRRMGPPHRQSMAEISLKLGIHVITLYEWLKAWRQQGEVVLATQKDPEGWGLPISSRWCCRPQAFYRTGWGLP